MRAGQEEADVKPGAGQEGEHVATGVCRDLLDSLGDYLDGNAAATTCAEIERHLAGCENCRIVVDTLRKTVSLYRELPQFDMPEAARQRLYVALDLGDLCRPAGKPEV
jgi:anti-sigma factor RsiW